MAALKKENGCKFALDDFGTGLSSFGYLKEFPVDFLKIDGSFVKGILRDPIDKEMVRSINEIGHLTGKLTIAEFAESAEIITMLKGLGVDYAQGYGIGSPQRILKVASNG
jgi:EAL domain-containing protein (putative c-di-GMP-specific phosphodiesterase class I)